MKLTYFYTITLFLFHTYSLQCAMLGFFVKKTLPQISLYSHLQARKFSQNSLKVHTKNISEKFELTKEKIKQIAQENEMLKKIKKWYHEKPVSSYVEQGTVEQKVMHPTNLGEQSNFQAAKAEGDHAATVTGFLNFPKNMTHSHTTIHNNYHYAPKGWAANFFEWLAAGNQTRSAGVGFVAGGIAGYGIHASLSKKEEKEKIIVVQVPSAREGIK